MQSETGRRSFVLDPRAKLLLLFTIALFLLGGIGGDRGGFLIPYLCLIPFFLLIVSGRIKASMIALLIYALSYLGITYMFPNATGILSYLVQGSAIIVLRIFPIALTAVYVFSSTRITVAAITSPRAGKNILNT